MRWRSDAFRGAALLTLGLVLIGAMLFAAATGATTVGVGTMWQALWWGVEGTLPADAQAATIFTVIRLPVCCSPRW